MREMSLLEQLEIAEEVLETDEGFKCKLKKKKEELKNVERHKKDLKKSIRSEEEWASNLKLFNAILIIGCILGVLGVCAAVAAIYFNSIKKYDIMRNDFRFYQFLFILAGLVVVVVTIIVTRRINKRIQEARNDKYKYERAYSEHCNQMPQMIADLEKEIESINMERQKYLEETRHHLLFLPRTYRKHESVSFMLECVSDCRADTLKEAINLWENELRYNAALRAAQQQAEEEQYYYEAILRETQRQADELERIRQNSDYERWNTNNN